MSRVLDCISFGKYDINIIKQNIHLLTTSDVDVFVVTAVIISPVVMLAIPEGFLGSGTRNLVQANGTTPIFKVFPPYNFATR